MPADDDAIGPGEMRRWLARIEDGLTDLGTKVENLPFVRTDVYETERDTLREDVAELKDSRTWLRRALAGGMIALVAGFGANFAYQVAQAAPNPAGSHITTGSHQ